MARSRVPRRAGIGCVEQRGDLFPCHIVDQGRVGPLCRDGTNTQREIKACWDAILDVTEERPDRRKSSVAGSGTIFTRILRVIEERHDKSGIEILDRQVSRSPLQAVGCEPDQKREAVRVGRNRMRADIALPRKMITQERGEMGSECSHAGSPRKSCSPAAAMSRRRTGVASRYQYVLATSVWPR